MLTLSLECQDLQESLFRPLINRPATAPIAELTSWTSKSQEPSIPERSAPWRSASGTRTTYSPGNSTVVACYLPPLLRCTYLKLYGLVGSSTVLPWRRYEEGLPAVTLPTPRSGSRMSTPYGSSEDR